MADDTETNTKLVTIKIDDRAETHRFAGNRVPVAVNGQIAHVPFNEETEVGEHITDALRNAGIPFTVVGSKDSTGPAAEGVSVADPLALVVPADDPASGNGEGEGHARQAPEELKQDPGTVHIETDIPTNELTTGAGGGGSTAGETAGDTGGANANGTADSTATNGEKQDEEPGLLDKSIPDLTEALKSVTSTDELDQLLAAEKAGKSRSGATAAIEARKAELTA